MLICGQKKSYFYQQAKIIKENSGDEFKFFIFYVSLYGLLQFSILPYNTADLIQILHHYLRHHIIIISCVHINITLKCIKIIETLERSKRKKKKLNVADVRRSEWNLNCVLKTFHLLLFSCLFECRTHYLRTSCCLIFLFPFSSGNCGSQLFAHHRPLMAYFAFRFRWFQNT